MRDFEASTLWSVSEYDRVRQRDGGSGFARLDGATVLSTTLAAELRDLERHPGRVDPLHAAAACVRHREPALLVLRYADVVWPVTVFPAEANYHSPRDFTATRPDALGRLALLAVEPPGLRPPGPWRWSAGATTDPDGNDFYRPLAPLLWALALHGPRGSLLAEIGGTAAYRALRDPDPRGERLRGVQRSALERLRRETASLREIAGWPGMSIERGSRLLNGLYLDSALLVSRAHPSARGEPKGFGRR